MLTNKKKLGSTRLACLAGILGAVLPQAAQAQQLANDVFQTNVNIEVLPFATLEFTGPPLLYLEIPPTSSSTIPGSGVPFEVTGNATASISAAPHQFMFIPHVGSSGAWMGKATQGGEDLGYRLQVEFPDEGVAGSSIQVGQLPGSSPDGTTPLTVDLTLTGGMRAGIIHLIANKTWTLDGGIPLPGLYEGTIVLTLTADY
jgi:hypothetical protein